MPRQKTQGPDWVPRNISFPLGLLCLITNKALDQDLPEEASDFIRRIMAKQVGYQRDLDYKYIREAIAKNRLDPVLVKLVRDLKLDEPRPVYEDEDD